MGPTVLLTCLRSPIIGKLQSQHTTFIPPSTPRSPSHVFNKKCILVYCFSHECYMSLKLSKLA
jgi:hypothetical protein